MGVLKITRKMQMTANGRPYKFELFSLDDKKLLPYADIYDIIRIIYEKRKEIIA